MQCADVACVAASARFLLAIEIGCGTLPNCTAQRSPLRRDTAMPCAPFKSGLRASSLSTTRAPERIIDGGEIQNRNATSDCDRVLETASIKNTRYTGRSPAASKRAAYRYSHMCHTYYRPTRSRRAHQSQNSPPEKALNNFSAVNMLPSCANKHATYRHAHQRYLRTRCWKGVLEIVQHSGCLDVPGAAACALARGNNDNGVPFVLDPHDKTLQDDLWHATFAGSVHIVTATIGHQHRDAVAGLIGDVLQPTTRICPHTSCVFE